MQAILHEVTGKNRYCGPTAIATVLGISTDDAAALARAQNGSNAIRGLHTDHLVAVLRKAGCKLAFHRVNDAPTMAYWLKRTPREAGKHYIVVFGNHFGTILGRDYLCSLTRRQRVGHADIPKRRARVVEYIVVESLPAAPVAVPVKARVSESTGTRKARTEAKRLAALHGIEIEAWRNPGEFNVWPPRWLDDDADPYNGDHFCYDWVDVHEMVAAYAKLAEARSAA